VFFALIPCASGRATADDNNVAQIGTLYFAYHAICFAYTKLGPDRQAVVQKK
jgi:hypothetical protein